jgi:hypothetical protein
MDCTHIQGGISVDRAELQFLKRLKSRRRHAWRVPQNVSIDSDCWTVVGKKEAEIIRLTKRPSNTAQSRRWKLLANLLKRPAAQTADSLGRKHRPNERSNKRHDDYDHEPDQHLHQRPSISCPSKSLGPFAACLVLVACIQSHPLCRRSIKGFHGVSTQSCVRNACRRAPIYASVSYNSDSQT